MIEKILNNLNSILIGKSDVTQLAVTCILAEGHLLIEDIPGVGKTTLARALAKLFGLQFNRIQFTNDLLPADILGGNIFNAKTSQFDFYKGPIFSQFMLADELNRASPKTQSAVLEAMEEKKVTIDGKSYSLPEPFFFIATQNPVDQSSTSSLPESQLDRFLMRIHIGFPDRKSEKQILKGTQRSSVIDNLPSLLNDKELLMLQKKCQQIFVSDKVIDYIQNIIDSTRSSKETGVSTRGALALLNAAKAFAFIQKREMVIPEDVQFVCGPVLAHRFISNTSEKSSHELIKEILATTKVP